MKFIKQTAQVILTTALFGGPLFFYMIFMMKP